MLKVSVIYDSKFPMNYDSNSIRVFVYMDKEHNYRC